VTWSIPAHPLCRGVVQTRMCHTYRAGAFCAGSRMCVRAHTHKGTCTFRGPRRAVIQSAKISLWGSERSWMNRSRCGSRKARAKKASPKRAMAGLPPTMLTVSGKGWCPPRVAGVGKLWRGASTCETRRTAPKKSWLRSRERPSPRLSDANVQPTSRLGEDEALEEERLLKPPVDAGRFKGVERPPQERPQRSFSGGAAHVHPVRW